MSNKYVKLNWEHGDYQVKVGSGNINNASNENIREGKVRI